ncbi:hypothetical protein HMPREF9124_2105 [Oribacterium sp. oral taxon 108 str. F0425]|nr:hypothetical protein HMPREF9124_2105 [Oribacterium sp. oral taxon 108 str. F0425]
MATSSSEECFYPFLYWIQYKAGISECLYSIFGYYFFMDIILKRIMRKREIMI